MSKLTLNDKTGNIVCQNEVVHGQLAVGSLIGANGRPLHITSDMIVDGRTQFNRNIQAFGGISNGVVPIWLGQEDMDVAGGNLMLSVSGYYQLKESVAGSFTITADDVSLNFSNQTVTPGDASPLYGVKVTGNRFKGWDGTIKGFECGVWFDGINDGTLRGLNVVNNVVPLNMMVQHAALPAAVVPTQFAGARAKRTAASTPTLKKPATKPAFDKMGEARVARKAAHAKPMRAAARTGNPKTAPKRANTKKGARAKPATTWRTAHAAKDVMLKPSIANARLANQVAARAKGAKVWVGPHNGVPFAGIYISESQNITLANIVCDNSSEVGIVLTDVYGFCIQDVFVSNGNRGMTLDYSCAGCVRNVNIYYNTDVSEYENSASFDITNCCDIQLFNVQVTDNYKGVYAETFDSNSGIMTVIDSEKIYFTDCSFSDNSSNFFDSSYPTMSALLVFGNNDCVFRNCHIDGNNRNNGDMPGGYLENCACMYNTALTFDTCTANGLSVYNAGETELSGWLVVANYQVTFKNCESSVLYADNTTNGSYVEGFIFVYAMGLTVENCKASGLENNSNDSSGSNVHLGIYDGSDGAVVDGFQCDGSDAGCEDENVGIDVDENYAVRIMNSSANELYSNNGSAVSFNIRYTDECVIDKCVATGNDGEDARGGGFYIYNSNVCTITNCVSNGHYGNGPGFGFMTDGGSQQCTFQNNKANNNYDFGFFDSSEWTNAWFANSGANNDTNFALYGNGNTYIFWSNDVWGGNNPWSTPGWVGVPPSPSAWDNVDIRYD